MTTLMLQIWPGVKPLMVPAASWAAMTMRRMGIQLSDTNPLVKMSKGFMYLLELKKQQLWG